MSARFECGQEGLEDVFVAREWNYPNGAAPIAPPGRQFEHAAPAAVDTVEHSHFVSGVTIITTSPHLGQLGPSRVSVSNRELQD